MNNSSVAEVAQGNINQTSQYFFNKLRAIEKGDLTSIENQNIEITLAINKDIQFDCSAEELLEAENKFTKLLLYGTTYELLNLYKNKLKPVLLSTHNKQSLEKMKSKTAVFVAVIARKLIKTGISPDIVMGYEGIYMEIIHHSKSTQDLLNIIEKLIVYSASLINQINHIEHINIISKTSKYVNEHISEAISLNDISKHVGLSVNYFSSLFKRELNKSFTRYVNECRVEKSKDLLKHSDLSLANIATKVGFKNQNYFTTIFKKYTGITPRQYREKNSVTFK